MVGLAIALVVPVRGYLSQRANLRSQEIALKGEMARRDAIAAQLRALRDNNVLEARAREIGLVRPGERVFRIVGLPRS